MIDFIIVGRGLAAKTIAHTFHKHGISFKIIGDNSLSACSKVAAGIWNPVVFKRLTKSWMAEEFIACLTTFYSECEKQIQKKIITQRQLIKPFTEDQEKDLWVKKANAELKNFLVKDVHINTTPQLEHLKISNGYGVVEKSGNLDVAGFLEGSSFFFKEHIINEIFDHKSLKIQEGDVVYKDLKAKNIIFCEGHLVKDNYLFNWIPLKPAKGEILTIKAPKLNFGSSIFNRNGFLMEIGAGTYRTGATYAWDDLTEQPTENGLAELKAKVENMISCDYSIVSHDAGIRPSSSDRRPIVGPHPKHPNVFVFNGLGTKGVMLAPFFSENFVHFYLQKEQLNPEVDVQRFYRLEPV